MAVLPKFSTPTPLTLETLTNELVNAFANLRNTFLFLDPVDNFQAFEVEVTIPAASEVEVRNRFRSGQIPKRWIVVDQVGPAIVARGDKPWTSDSIYLQNASSSTDTTVKVIFML